MEGLLPYGVYIPSSTDVAKNTHGELLNIWIKVKNIK